MDLEEKLQRGRAGYEEARYQFIITELELALTFANIAVTADDLDSRQRNTNHARQAYDAAAQRIDERELPPRKQGAVERRLRKLETVFQKLSARGRRITFR